MTPDPEDTANLQGTEPEKVGYKHPPKSAQFKKGYDPKRNMRGVPKDTVAMRKHMREIAAEIIGSGDSEMTRLSAMLRQLWTSRNPAHNKLALQVLDPKILTENIEHSGETITKVIFEYSEDTTPKATPSAATDQSGTEET
jgi:hypothetical protein